MTKAEECLICKEPLVYFNEGTTMKCYICGKEELSTTRCKNNHFVCNECHSVGVPLIKEICANSNSKNPIEITEEIMNKSFIHMHGPEHHILVGSALLTAYKNSGGNIDLKKSLEEMEKRGKQVPGGTCGFWGACGASISLGIFISIITGATPLTNNPWKLSNLATSKALEKVSEIGGPRCCKRNSFIAIETAINFVEENMGIKMEKESIKCKFKEKNNQCIKNRCPYFN